jgi:isopentenyl-diphosphate delta-isomerase
LQRSGGIEYRADVGGGLIEHEVVEVFSAQAPAHLVPQPDPDEVMQTRWITLETLEVEVRATPEKFTPWLRIYLAEGMAEAAV